MPTLAAVCLFAASGPATAQVVGRLRFVVRNAADEKPLVNARITLKDSASVRPDAVFTTDTMGTVVSGALDARAWRVTTEADSFTPDSRDVTVVQDSTTEVEILLEPLKERVIRITTQRQALSPTLTGTLTRREPTFLKSFPTNAGNPQSLPDLLRSVPGLAANSVNQIHPRGEHSATGIVIDGFYLPGVLQGRAGQVLVPNTIQSLNVMTGSFAPEFGGETAAVLDVRLRQGTVAPTRDLLLQGGSFNTFFGNVSVGGQAGGLLQSGTAGGEGARKFRYFVDVSGRRTDNALEPPQPDNQTANNTSSSQSYFVNLGYQPGRRDELTFVLNHTPAFSETANRTGLDGSFAAFGQGFGYGGELSRADALAAGILNQDRAGQDVGQRDLNTFGILSWRREFSDRLRGVFSFGAVSSDLDIRNNNPLVDPRALPADSSIEFNPTVLRNSRHFQPQGSLTYQAGKHTLKAGFLYDIQRGDESYQFIPGSQIALNTLFATDPRLAPRGDLQFDAAGDPILDRRGNQVFLADPANPNAPRVRVRRRGHYAAGFLQDTWNVSRTFTVNYGLRADFFKQTQNLGLPGVDSGALSPRVNLSYAADPRTVVRASYNRLFVQPPLAQGTILGAAIQPQTSHQFDVSVERQLAPRQVAKAGYYFKNIRNLLDTGLLIEGTQLGAYGTISLARTRVRGFELSYELLPKDGAGWSAYFAGTFGSFSQPSGLTNTGEPVEAFTDHDQRTTVNFGLAYALKNGLTAGLNLYHGSGVFSSAVFDGGARNGRTQVNLRLASGPQFAGKRQVGLELVVENLLDDRSVINFASPFSGTRFQQGRRVLFSLSGKF